MAASADYAITNHFPRLASTHALAARLAGGLEELGCEIQAQVDTNMVRCAFIPRSFVGVALISLQVFYNPTPLGLTLDSIMARLKSLPIPITVMRERCVVHHQTSPQAVEDFIDTVREMKAEKDIGGHPEKEGERLSRGERMVGAAKLRKEAALGY